MSNKRIINTEMAPEAIGPYSQATSSGNSLYVSGQLGFDVPAMTIPEDFVMEVKNALYNLKSIVEAAESRMDRILKVTVYLTDMNDFEVFNDIYSNFFFAQPPAREVVCVKALPRGGRIEVSAFGFIQDSM